MPRVPVAGHCWTPGRFGSYCRVMLARGVCPWGRLEHPEGPPEDLDAFGRVRRFDLPIHRTEAGYPNCSTCDGGGCPDCTDLA